LNAGSRAVSILGPQGHTTKLVRKAIEMHTAGKREDGLAIPNLATTVEDMTRALSLARSWGGHLAHRAACRACHESDRLKGSPAERFLAPGFFRIETICCGKSWKFWSVPLGRAASVI